MRTHGIAIGLFCSILLSGVAAQAGLLTSATWVGDRLAEPSGPLSSAITLFPGTPFTLVTSGASLSASGSAVGSSIGNISLSVAAPTLNGIGVDPGNGHFFVQTLGGSQTINSANMASQGIAGSFDYYIGVNSSSGNLLFHVPLSVGVAGNFTTTAVLLPGLNVPVEVTATFFPWTTGSQTLTGLTSSGVAMPDLTIGGSNSLVGGVGSITLVSPTRIQVCVGEFFGTFPCARGRPSSRWFTGASATKLTLNFAAVPEPGSAFLLGAASTIGFAAARRRRRIGRSAPARRQS